MFSVLLVELACLLCTFFFLRQQNNHSVLSGLKYLSQRISRSTVIQLNTTNYNLRQYAAVTRVHSIYLSEAGFADILQTGYNPQTITVQSFAFVAAVNDTDRLKFEAFCSRYIEDGCTVKDVSGPSQYAVAPRRPLYYPVMLLYPSPYKPSLIGLDLSVPPLSHLFEEMQSSVALNDSIITRKVNLATPNPRNQYSYGVIMSFPVFAHPANTSSTVLGYHAGIMRLEDIVAQAILRVTIPRKSVSVIVFDNTVSTESTLLYKDPIAAFSQVWSDADVSVFDALTVINARNRVWHIYYLYSDDYKRQQRSTLPVLITCASAGLFVLADLIVFALLLVGKLWLRASTFETENRRANNMLNYANHEIRNPLNVIQHLILYTKKALKSLQPAAVDFAVISTAVEDLHIVGSQCDFLEHIVSDVLVIQKLEAGMLQLNPKLCALDELMRDLQNTVRHKEEENSQVKISFSYDPAATLVVDAFRLKQILLNFLTNAMKYTTEGSIQVVTTQTQEHTLFSVYDTGRGIKECNRHKIFTAFTHINSFDAARHGSNGIGLYLVHMLAGLMGGTVGYRSSPAGSVFWVQLRNDTEVDTRDW